MKRPESMLAAGVVGLVGAIGVLVAVSMTSCETEGAAKSSKVGEKSVVHPGTSGGAGKPYVRAAGEPDMRVRILTTAESVKVGALGGLKIAKGEPKGATSDPTGAGGWSGAERMETGGPVTISFRGGVGGAWTVNGAGGLAGEKNYSGPSALLIAPANPGEMLSINGAAFPGVLRVSARTDVKDSAAGAGMFDCVLFVPLEEYLGGVVAKEMLAGWPLGAYQVQAVAARTYALQERERTMNAASASGGLGSGFDVESSDKDQVYAGATTNKVALEAVRSTRGIVLMDGDRMLRAYFSSTCGGRNASAKDTWPTGPGFEYNLAAPIQAHERESACAASPLYRWTTERPRGELLVRIRTFGERNGLMVRQIKDLAAIQVMSVNADNRPNRYKVIEPGGKWFQLSAEEMRLACNTNVSGNAVMPTGGAPVAASTATGTEGAAAGSGAMAAGAGGGAGGTGSTKIPDIDRKSRVHSSDFEVTITGEKVVFAGRGFGHGVGMCQYCAKAMAERGDDWRTMMERFYPGARIVNLY